MATIKPLLKYWVCVGPRERPDESSISYKRTDSIKKFMANGYTGKYAKWATWRYAGWRCVKVNINFQIIKP